jgi:hypothetical protein
MTNLVIAALFSLVPLPDGSSALIYQSETLLPVEECLQKSIEINQDPNTMFVLMCAGNPETVNDIES